MSDDDILDSYLAGDSEISTLYRSSPAETEQPSTATDNAILAAAKRSVASRPQGLSADPLNPEQQQPEVARKNPLQRWFVPLSVAATLVLSTSIYLGNQPHWTGAPSLAPSGYDDTAGQAPKPQKSLEPVLKAQMATEVAADTQLQQEHHRAEKKILMAMPATARSEPLGSTAAPRTLEENTGRFSAGIATEADQLSTAANRANHSLEKQSRDTASLQRLAPAPASMKALPLAPIDYRSSPARWLQKIEQLTDEGDLGTAQDELDAFRIKHPEYPLPERLGVRLKRPSD